MSQFPDPLMSVNEFLHIDLTNFFSNNMVASNAPPHRATTDSSDENSVRFSTIDHVLHESLTDNSAEKYIAIYDLQKEWRKASLEIRRLCTSYPDSPVVQRSMETFNELPWNAFVEDSESEFAFNTRSLIGFIPDEWLSSDHIVMMLNLLSYDIRCHRYINVSVANPFFIVFLSQAHNDRYTYRELKEYAWLRQLGEQLRRGYIQYIATIISSSKDHWSSLIIDAQHTCVMHGDSLGRKLTAHQEGLLRWWMAVHLDNARSVTFYSLPTHRQSDTYSCGILAYQSLISYFFPDEIDFGRLAEPRKARLAVFLRFVNLCKRFKTSGPLPLVSNDE